MFDEPLGAGNIIDAITVVDAEWEKQSPSSVDVQMNKLSRIIANQRKE